MGEIPRGRLSTAQAGGRKGKRGKGGEIRAQRGRDGEKTFCNKTGGEHHFRDKHR